MCRGKLSEGSGAPAASAAALGREGGCTADQVLLCEARLCSDVKTWIPGVHAGEVEQGQHCCVMHAEFTAFTSIDSPGSRSSLYYVL